jgi:hypothetical protein
VPPTSNVSPAPRAAGAAPAQAPFALLVLNWLVPGLGWLVAGRKARGAISFLLVMVTFVLGLVLHGGVSWPCWDPANEAFNLINNFTLLIQFGAGLPALVSLIADQFQFAPLGGLPKHAYYELGGYFIVVAGAINYFSTCNLYDRLMRHGSRFAAQELGLPEPGAAPAAAIPPQEPQA